MFINTAGLRVHRQTSEKESMSKEPQILFIDGDKEERDYFSERLKKCCPEMTTLHADTGDFGFALCKRGSIDCVILEIDLPDKSGFEVLLKLVPRVWHPDHAVIVLTRIANTYLLQAARTNGAKAAFYKPMTSGDMLCNAVLKAMAAVPSDGKMDIA